MEIIYYLAGAALVVYGFVKQALKSNIEWLTYREKVVKFYYRYKKIYFYFTK